MNVSNYLVGANSCLEQLGVVVAHSLTDGLVNVISWLDVGQLKGLLEYIMHYIAQDQGIADLHLFKLVLKNAAADAGVAADYLGAGDADVWLKNYIVVTFVVNCDAVVVIKGEDCNHADHVTRI